ncbi:uncharacterized protein LOC110828084 isoform X2 [Zootermopsis nevadensis]|uniref:uncharacterized protein LOC110828084 isoform X2 n=1 Tax=Zootermopsis nevadensis TaxID=136037 RepID=UPI000B8ED30C|nr:uncharacterized protein LOC110828084 isoform X2 [Zootermopsis nevadensis]
MRVPPQRSSRSNTATSATSGGKRLSTSISVSGNPALSVKKRKLQSETPSGNKTSFKTTSVGDASTSDQHSKRKQPLPQIKKTLHHFKKRDAALLTKSLKSNITAKKPHSNKSSNVPLVGLKKIKFKEGRLTIKKILVTSSESKPQKKLAKPATKTAPTKKQTNNSNKKVISAVESLSVPPVAEDQAPGGSNCGKYSSETEDKLSALQKKTQYRNQPSSKQVTKKAKTVIGKSKSSALISAPVPFTRTKKLEQKQKVKTVKKICLKTYPVTRHVMVMHVEQEATAGGKKKVPTRRKQITGEDTGGNDTSSHVTSKTSGSPTCDRQLSGGAGDNLESSNHVTSQAPEKIVSKGSAKKAKDEESAIKETDKKKVAKKKPKTESAGKGNGTGIEDKVGVIISVPTKDKSEVSVPKKEGKIGNKDDSTSKVKCVKKKKKKPKPTDALLSKGKPTKKSPVLKNPKVISTKANKIKMPKITSNTKVVKKQQQSKKKEPRPAVKNVVTKIQFSADCPVDARQEEEVKQQDDDDDSSTSDEITLDVLFLRQQQMKQEKVMSDELPFGQRYQCEGISGPSSLIDTSKQVTAQNVEIKPSLPMLASVKVEEPVPNLPVDTLSPSTINTSDDEDLKSIKNRIKIKLEEDNTEIGREKLSAQSEKNTKKKMITAKLRSDDSFTNRGKSEDVNIKKEAKDETENKKSDSDVKVTSDNRGKERVKKLLSVKRSRVDGGKNGGSGSDTEQRARRMKLFGFWSGPKRHRVASLNALAKVHCLYENESRGALLGICGTNGGSSRRTSKPPPSPENDTVIPTRTLRSAPGLRGMGKHWDMHNASSTSSSSPSSDDNESNSSSYIARHAAPPVSSKQKRRQPKMATSTAACSIKKKSKQIKNMKNVVKRRRNRCELMMDLKDMVVRKRMASLNASAILAASYSVEKRAVKSVKEDCGTAVGADSSVNSVHQVKKKTKKRLVTKKIVEVEDDSSSISSEIEIEECDVGGRGSTRSVIEVRTTPSGGPNSNKKVAVIVNQDTDVTITGVYVNSTTRSTHHEGYRISSTSHTQTEATAVATETVLHSSAATEHPPSQHHPAEPPLAPPMKSYTPLGALSNMQPPGAAVVGGPPPPHHHHHPHAHPHAHAPPCNVPPQQPPPHRGGPINPGVGPVHPPISPLGRRHGCSSAFSAPPPPPTAAYGPPPQHPQPPHHHHPLPPQGQQDPTYIHGECSQRRSGWCIHRTGGGYYQPAGPLISTHHHHHSSSSSISSKVPPAVLPTLEASPNPTPPPSAVGHSGPGSVQPTTTTAIVPPTPQQLVSAASTRGGGGGARSGGDESDSDVIITATSCSGGGEVAPPPPVPQPLPLQQHPHQAGYRYAQSYPPPPTPSTPQHIHHQSYTYNYPHTQYYPSPPASASIQYSAVATNPPSLQQHHTHYHNQDLCYSTTANYPPAPYFHHKSYSTPPPSAYHRRYIPPPHQYYTSDLYSSPVSNVSQQNSGQSQQSQQMVVTGSSAGSASSYQPPGAPPPPPLVGVSSNPPPPLVDTYPPPVSIVDPYPPPPPPGYYTGYSAGPGAAGCYTHSPPTRSLFIDAAYQSCPCPMQSCPKNVHTGPLTGDGKGPHITTKQQQQPVQESGASFHQLPLPPVALALPLEPPGALGPPSPARGSAGMPPPPSPATASARNPSHTQEEAALQQRGWVTDAGGTEPQSKLETRKQEPTGQDCVGETKLNSTVEVIQDLHSMPDQDFGSGATSISSDEDVCKTDISRHRLLAISKIVANPDVLACRAKAKKNSPPAVNGVPLLMCNLEIQKKGQNSAEVVLTKPENMMSVEPKMVNHIMKTEVRNLDIEVFVENDNCPGLTQNGNKAIFRDGSSRKRSIQPVDSDAEVSVPKRCKLSVSNADNSRLSVSNQESQKTNGAGEPQDQMNGVPLECQTKCRNRQKSQPLHSNICSLHSTKHNARKRKHDDAKNLTENKEPPAKKKGETKVQRLQTKIYPSRAKQVKKITTECEAPKRIDDVPDSVVTKSRTILEPLVTTRRNNSSNVAPVSKKTSGSKSVERKKSENKINGALSHQKKPFLRHQAGKQQLESSNCLRGDVSKVHIHTHGKKAHQRKKSEHISLSLEETYTSEKTVRVGHMLRSRGLRDSLSDQSSSDTETIASRGKVSSCSSFQNPSPITAVRRTSTGSRKDQSKKSASLVVRNDDISTIKKQTQQPQQDTTVAVMTALSRKVVPKKLLQSPKWSNGWKFEGDPFESKVFVSSDDELKLRKCYPLMRHNEGDVIRPRDCILLKSGPRKTDLPFVAKVASLWENPDDGEMMVSLLWYYRPEHTDHGRKPDDMEDEIFASKHKDINSVACIEDKCYVLTFNEYCRYRKCVRRVEEGVKEPGLVVPQHDEYPRENRQPPGCVAPELVFFCRRVYDFRQRRILKNPG